LVASSALLLGCRPRCPIEWPKLVKPLAKPCEFFVEPVEPVKSREVAFAPAHSSRDLAFSLCHIDLQSTETLE
jgi:hypothetical protein